MNKIVVIPDLHGLGIWKYIITQNEDADLYIFLGDYLDSFNILGEEQGKNLLDIIEFKKRNTDRVILVLGNHDIHYWPGIGDTGTSGYQADMAPTFTWIFENNKDLFQMAYKHENILFTHAGFAPTWIESLVKYANIPEELVQWNTETIDQVINNIWKYKPYSFLFRDYNGRSDPYGDNPWQSPIWIRPKSLMADSKMLAKTNNLIQIVGHTQQNQIDIKGKSTGGHYYFIDTLGTSREYLVIDNGEFKTEKV